MPELELPQQAGWERWQRAQSAAVQPEEAQRRPGLLPQVAAEPVERQKASPRQAPTAERRPLLAPERRQDAPLPKAFQPDGWSVEAGASRRQRLDAAGAQYAAVQGGLVEHSTLRERVPRGLPGTEAQRARGSDELPLPLQERRSALSQQAHSRGAAAGRILRQPRPVCAPG